MSKFGRPSKDAVAERRRSIKIFLAVSARASDDAVERIAKRLQVGEKAIRSDLDALRDEFEHDPSEELCQGLEEAIAVADTIGALRRLGKKVMAEMVKGDLDRALARALVEAIKEQRQLLVRQREEQSEAAIMALELLTPEEDALLKEHRAKLAGPPLKPGEAVPPPSAEEKPPAEEKRSAEEKPPSEEKSS